MEARGRTELPTRGETHGAPESTSDEAASIRQAQTRDRPCRCPWCYAIRGV